jgi:hypothetical protein
MATTTLMQDYVMDHPLHWIKVTREQSDASGFAKDLFDEEREGNDFADEIVSNIGSVFHSFTEGSTLLPQHDVRILSSSSTFPDCAQKEGIEGYNKVPFETLKDLVAVKRCRPAQGLAQLASHFTQTANKDCIERPLKKSKYKMYQT